MNTKETTNEAAPPKGLRVNLLFEGMLGWDVFIGRAPSNPRSLHFQRLSDGVKIESGRWEIVASRVVAAIN